jgi:hypothetical protein
VYFARPAVAAVGKTADVRHVDAPRWQLGPLAEDETVV